MNAKAVICAILALFLFFALLTEGKQTLAPNWCMDPKVVSMGLYSNLLKNWTWIVVLDMTEAYTCIRRLLLTQSRCSS